jgi:glycerophosphoryl diester phosphodiesterase
MNRDGQDEGRREQHSGLMSIQVVGHRGAAGVAPENTMPSFEAAWAAGVAWVETDVRLTRDGVPVLLHDATLERTTTGEDRVSDLSWTEVLQVDAGARFGSAFAGTLMPRLEQLLEAAAGRSSVLIELKAESVRPDLLVERVLAAVEAADAAGWVRLISFEPDLLERVHRAAGSGRIPTGLISSRDEGLVDTAAKLGCTAVHPGHSALSPVLAASARAAGLRVNTWTLNDPERVLNAMAMGVDEITTDFPAMVVELLGSAG